jgi:hypothetical protein
MLIQLANIGKIPKALTNANERWSIKTVCGGESEKSLDQYFRLIRGFLEI